VYITVFDLIDPLNRLPRWRNFSPANRALIAGLLIVIVLLLLGGTAVVTSYHYVPLVILGVFSGGVVSKVLSQFLAPKIQSHVTAFLGGITTGNIGRSGENLRKLIAEIGEQINKLVALAPRGGDLSGPMVLCLWVGLLTTLVILGANAYYANQKSSTVGELVNPPAAPGPSPAPVGGGPGGP